MLGLCLRTCTKAKSYAYLGEAYYKLFCRVVFELFNLNMELQILSIGPVMNSVNTYLVLLQHWHVQITLTVH